MFDPSSMTVGQAISHIRDIVVIAGVLSTGWKLRGYLQKLLDFGNRCYEHMTYMEAGLNTLLNNHMKHIEADLKTIAGREVD